jgi:hypothetical protein
MFKNISSSQQKYIKILVIGLTLLYLVIGFFSVVIINKSHGSKIALDQLKETSIVSPERDEKGAVKVSTGIYLDSIETVSIKESYWIATFYVWFRWVGEDGLDPGKAFYLVDGKINSKILEDSYVSPEGLHYQCYRVEARITNFFNTMLLPLESHVLTISIEDAVLDDTKLVYIPDSSSNKSPRLNVPGFVIKNFSQYSEPHTYQTNYGDPLLNEGDYTTYSQYNFALRLKRVGFGFYIKLFIGMFAGVFLTLGSFFIRPSDTGPRYGIPSAAYFGAVANTYMVNALMPPSGDFGLTDLVTLVGLLTITICVAATLLSGYFYLRKNEQEFSKAIDMASWITIGVWYILINIMLPVLAFS